MPCRDIIKESEVLRAHRIISKNLVGNLCRKPDCDSYRRYDVIDLKDKLGNSILNVEIAFEFLKDSRFFGTTGRGKVAKLHNIRIKPDKKTKGLGSEIHAQQLSVLKNNHFKELQLSAQWDGVIAWPSIFFNFTSEDDEDELLEHIASYMFDVLKYNNDKVTKIMQNYDNIKSLAKHLRPESKIWFTDWYQETNRSLEYKMYKEIS